MKLTMMQHNRLIELRNVADGKLRSGHLRYAGFQKATTQKLADAGLVEIRGRKIAKTGRVMVLGDAHITEAGRAALAAHSQKD